MAYWIGVVGSREGVERLRGNDETWWCLSRRALAGDFLAIYVARHRLPSLPLEETGFVAIYEILGPEPDRAADCRKFGGASFGDEVPSPVKIALRERYAVSLRLADMKHDPILKNATFVRRSFQGTYFSATASEFSRIKRVLEHRKRVQSPDASATPSAAGTCDTPTPERT